MTAISKRVQAWSTSIVDVSTSQLLDSDRGPLLIDRLQRASDA